MATDLKNDLVTLSRKIGTVSERHRWITWIKTLALAPGTHPEAREMLSFLLASVSKEIDLELAAMSAAKDSAPAADSL